MKRNGLEQRTPLRQYTPLKAKTPLRAHTRLKPVSKRQSKINDLWRKITDQKAYELEYICQWCGGIGSRPSVYGNYPGDFPTLHGHHIIKRRFGLNTPENCYICHDSCHQEITDRNVDVAKFPNREAWLKNSSKNP